MTYQEIYNFLEESISPKRFRHIQGVVEAAIQLAEKYQCSKEKARLAALLHDCCKEYSNEELKGILAEDYSLDKVILNYPSLLHGPAGAIIAKDKFKVNDEEILEAVRVHTTGKINMSLLDKIVFLADYIEPNRKFKGVDELRQLAMINLDEAVLEGFNGTIKKLIDQHAEIYTGTIEARNYMLNAIKSAGSYHE